MNLILHGIDADPCPIVSGKDSLASPPGDKDRASLVLTNPPFGKKSTMAIVNEEGELEKEDEAGCEHRTVRATSAARSRPRRPRRARCQGPRSRTDH